ncbi:DUF47 domain-containing protein [Nesterenkonia sp. F]|uniref:DUF47 domain-containing protein n=1 Tax=Nesterenkonia sp. F TaxID=795955 RepID=UPI000255CA36|nr:hypothetical protein [Nesterenkonia sp. F]
MTARRTPGRSQVVDLLVEIARELRHGINLLSEVIGTPETERESLHQDLVGLEGTTMDLHARLMTSIRSVFLTPLPREDIYALSQMLNRSLEHVVSVGDLFIARGQQRLTRHTSDQLEILGRQADLTVEAMARLDDFDFLEEYWGQIQRLTKQAQRTHRAWLTASDGAFQPNLAHQQTQLSVTMMMAVESLREVATAAGSIIVRES